MKPQTERVLIIDKDRTTRRELARYLEGRGFYVSGYDDLPGAQALLAERPPDVIFADLPPQAIRKLGALEAVEEQRIPIIAYSEATTAEEVIEALRAGAADFVAKPLVNKSCIDDVLGKLFEHVRVTRLNHVYRQELEDINSDLREGIAELRADQSAGRKVQLKMLPEHDRRFGDLQLDYLIKPSLYLSGDFLDYFRIDEHRVLVYIADVSGHGASSAFVTVLLKNLTSRLQRNLKRGSSNEVLFPDRFLRRINKELLDTRLGKHLTSFVGIIDTQERELHYVVGAHFPMPILASADQADFLEGSGLPVGLFEKPEWEIFRVALPKPFNLVLFSDGILEVIDAKGLDEKENRLLELVSEGRQTIASLSAALGLDEISELPDDIAIVTVTDGAAEMGGEGTSEQV
jgi:sigma-B regulation protein RsbU (phosphoserine phosphatase)